MSTLATQTAEPLARNDRARVRAGWRQGTLLSCALGALGMVAAPAQDAAHSPMTRERLGLPETLARFKRIDYMLDPRLRRPDSPLYTDKDSRIRATLQRCELLPQELSSAGRTSEPEVVAILDDVFTEFFNTVVGSRADVKMRKSLADRELLAEGSLATDNYALVTIGVDLKLELKKLVSTVEVRVFHLTIEPTEDRNESWDDLTHCELLFQDVARGEVEVAQLGEKPAAGNESSVPGIAKNEGRTLIRRAVIEALRSRLAVTLCDNPRLRQDDELKLVTSSGTLSKSVLGRSIQKDGSDR